MSTRLWTHGPHTLHQCHGSSTEGPGVPRAVPWIFRPESLCLCPQGPRGDPALDPVPDPAGVGAQGNGVDQDPVARLPEQVRPVPSPRLFRMDTWKGPSFPQVPRGRVTRANLPPLQLCAGHHHEPAAGAHKGKGRGVRQQPFPENPCPRSRALPLTAARGARVCPQQQHDREHQASAGYP